jgi:hypothetical protein
MANGDEVMNLANMHSNTQEEAQGDEETNVTIINYTNIGSIKGFGKASVEAREFVIPDKKYIDYFIGVETESSGDYPQTGKTLIKLKNVEKLLSSIDSLSRANITRDRFAFTEYQYEVDGLKIVVFNNDRGQIMFMIGTENISTHFTEISRLQEFRNLIQKAKMHLERARVDN